MRNDDIFRKILCARASLVIPEIGHTKSAWMKMIHDWGRQAERLPYKVCAACQSRIVERALRLPVPGGTSWGALSREIMSARQIRTVKWLLDILKGLVTYLVVKSFPHPRYQRNQRLNSVT